MPVANPYACRMPAEDVERIERRRKVLRVVLLWGLLGVMLLAAMAFSQSVRGEGEAMLADEPSVFGPLSARLPAGWAVNEIPLAEGGLELRATDPTNLMRSASVRLVPSRRWADAGTLIEANYESERLLVNNTPAESEVIDHPRDAQIGPYDGAIATVAIVVPAMDWMAVMYVRVVAAPVSDDWAVFVEVERAGEWAGEDAQLVRAIARTVRIGTVPQVE